MSLQDDLEDKSLSYQERVSKLRPIIEKAFRSGANRFNDRLSKILDLFIYPGSFGSRAEADQWLRINASSPEIEILRQDAMSLPEEHRDRFLKQIEKKTYNFSFTRKGVLDMMADLCTASVATRIIRRSTSVLTEVASEAYGRSMFEVQKGVGLAFGVGSIPERMLSAVLGSELSFTKAQGMAKSMIEPMREIMFKGILSGSNVRDIAREVSKVTETSEYKARAYSRTMLTEVSNEAEKRTLEEAGFRKYRYLATLDERTCPVCGRLDGEVFLLSKAKAGTNFPPMHKNCRCVHTAVLNDNIRQKYLRRARDSEGRSITVPQSMTYQEWAREYLGKEIG